MKHHCINATKIVEAKIFEPYESNGVLPFDDPTHGWQVVFYMETNLQIVINLDSEQECLDLLSEFGLFLIF